MQQLFEFMINHWGLWLALLGILALLFASEAQLRHTGRHILTPFQAISLINHENATIVDIRNKSLFQKGHIINALNLKPDNLSKYKDKKVILVCGNGQASTSLSAKLQKEGFGEISVIKGGLTAWLQAELPTTEK